MLDLHAGRQVFEVCGQEPLINVAIALEKAALTDKYFVDRKLYPNVDFYSGLIYRGSSRGLDHVFPTDSVMPPAMGFPIDFFPVLFGMPGVLL